MRLQRILPIRPDLGLLVLRLGVGGFLLFAHGLPKLLSAADKASHFPDPLHIGAVPSFVLAAGAESLGALLVVLGLWTQPAALAVLITMLVAGLVQHAADPFAKKELALLYAVPFAALLFTGAGAWSLDARLKRRAA
ncbi:MAG TPA: DoxX family protein [Polyangiales bacterium]